MEPSRWTGKLAGLIAAALTMALLGGCVPGSREDSTSQAAQTTPGQEKSPEVLAKVRDGMVIVRTTLQFPSGTEELRGSGFLISDTGHLITSQAAVSATVVRDDDDEVASTRLVTVTLRPGTDEELVVSAEVERESVALGVALVKIEEATPVYLTTALTDTAQTGDVVWACGCGSTLGTVSVQASAVTGRVEGAGGEMLALGAAEDPTSFGGPVVTEEGQVIGVLAAGPLESAGQHAVTYEAVAAWLTSDPAGDPGAPKPGDAIGALLEATGLEHSPSSNGVFSVPYKNGVTVFVHQNGKYLRVFVPQGAYDPEQGLRALVFTYYDPVGKMSVYTHEGKDLMTWEAQVPIRYVRAGYLKFITDVAATQAERWKGFIKGEEPEDWYNLYPGGDNDELTKELEAIVTATVGSDFESKETSFKIPGDEVDVWTQVFRGVAYIYAFSGGMPGEGQSEQLVKAKECLRRNFSDPLGRLSLDDDNDMVWEVQVPMEWLTSDMLRETMAVGRAQVTDWWDTYGHVPFNETTDDS